MVFHGCLKALNTGEVEGILCRVMKLKNPIFANSGSMRISTCNSTRKILNFSPFKSAFCVILHQTHVVITRPVPNAAGTSPCVLMHTGIK